MTNKTQKRTKLAVAVFMLLQFSVFCAHTSADNREPFIFFKDENIVISGFEKVCIKNHYDDKAEAMIRGLHQINTFSSKQIEQTSNSKIKITRNSTPTCMLLQYNTQYPFYFLFACRNIAANLPTNNHKRQRKLPSFNSNIFKTFSNLLENNYLFKFYVLKFATLNYCMQTYTVIRISAQYGCLTAFSANSPPRFINLNLQKNCLNNFAVTSLPMQ